MSTNTAVQSDQQKMLSFNEVVRGRRASRGFLSTPVPDVIINEALEEAQSSPSNCNTQPWSVHIVSGAKRDELSAAMLSAARENRFSMDFSFSVDDYFGRYKERQSEQVATYYRVLNVERSDAKGREEAVEKNYQFYNAPHVALLFMPSFGDNVRVASDIGMYGQTLLLALAARGVASIPQTVLGFFADTARNVLGISPELKLLFGISFGYHDPDAQANLMRMGRDSMASNVTFYK